MSALITRIDEDTHRGRMTVAQAKHVPPIDVEIHVVEIWLIPRTECNENS